MLVAVVGATGLVGTKMLRVLEERNFPVTSLLPVASERSWGKKVSFQGKKWTVMSAEEAIAQRPALALFSAGGAASGELAPRFAAAGCRVVDNSSFWRMDPAVPLVVPEINPDAIGPENYIIANPNCSTIQMVLPLAPLHKAYGIKRIVVSTYQSVTGAGQRGIEQLEAERAGGSGSKFPHRIDLNILPHIDSFLPDGYTKEEMKMVNETRKILGDSGIAVSATTVRVPVKGGHSESVNVEFLRPFELKDAVQLMADMPGVVIQDKPEENLYPMPLTAWEKDEVFVGRIRRDPSVENGLNLWCVSDNIRKGAATNAVQIAQVLLKKGWIA
ncbi:MAG: aspartate-semialdehyde dehydrogenase [Bacteroidales bacterium]|nr:aspartate-semialdehyde dehydrogenase [Bacteroidales bacterium]MBR1782564.1 aspartate-semialdehyde dehydrogenase [Bacteroidales bacterium]